MAAFTMKTGLSFRYNDKSVLENLHVATAFNVLGRAEYFLTLARHYTHPCTPTRTRPLRCDIFSKLRTDNYRKVRKLMIEMVTHTTHPTRVFAHVAPRHQFLFFFDPAKSVSASTHTRARTHAHTGALHGPRLPLRDDRAGERHVAAGTARRVPPSTLDAPI
jgi:hypothetical protein